MYNIRLRIHSLYYSLLGGCEHSRAHYDDITQKTTTLQHFTRATYALLDHSSLEELRIDLIAVKDRAKIRSSACRANIYRQNSNRVHHIQTQ